MRVLIVIAEMSTGGAERTVVELTEGLSSGGDDVAVAAGTGAFDSRLAAANPERYVFAGRGRSPVNLIRAATSVGRAVRDFGPDVIHAHNVKATGTALAARMLANAKAAPLVATFHGVPKQEYRLSARVLARADLVTCVSKDLIDGLTRAGVPKQKLRLVRNAVPPQGELDPQRVAALNRELALNGARVVSLVGRLVPQKAPERFLRAARRVADELADVRFLIVGDGPLRRDLESLTAELGLTQRVIFTGMRSDARDLIARSDLVVFSSDWEGMPVVALESLAAGVPVVATEVEGMGELLHDEAGVVVPRDSDSIGAAISSLLEDPERRARMGIAGRRIIAADYRVEAMIDAYRTLYREALARRAPFAPTST